ncbi:MAG: hypothetical protein WBV35_01550 [Steroidobacteraceae bacterium]
MSRFAASACVSPFGDEPSRFSSCGIGSVFSSSFAAGFGADAFG